MPSSGEIVHLQVQGMGVKKINQDWTHGLRVVRQLIAIAEWSIHHLENDRDHHVGDLLQGRREADLVAVEDELHLDEGQLPAISEHLHVAQDASRQEISQLESRWKVLIEILLIYWVYQ